MTADETAGVIPEEVSASRDPVLTAWEGTRTALEAYGYMYSEGPNWIQGVCIDGCFLTPSGAVIGICIDWAGPQQND